MMENLSDPQTLYKELVFTCFDKIKKHLQKKDKDIAQLISQFLDQLKDDKDLNANKYYAVFKLCIETRDTKLVETSLYYLHKLVSHGFLDGGCADFVSKPALEDKTKAAHEGSGLSRKLIDLIVENICLCKNEKNENIQLQIIKLLLTLVTSLTCEVHGKSLQETVRTLFTIYLTTKNPVNQATARAALTQIVNVIFQRMEEYNSKEEDYKAKKKDLVPTMSTKFKAPERKRTINESQPMLSQQIIGGNGSNMLQRAGSPEPQNIIDRYFNNNEDAYSVVSSVSGASTINYLQEQLTTETFDMKYNPGITGTLEERYIYRCVKNLVDDVCLYYGKASVVKNQYDNAKGEHKHGLGLLLKNIPLKAVPLSLDSDAPGYRLLTKVDLENEIGETAGYFGWCIMCRGPANWYCKDTRVPVCSVECKIMHKSELKKLKEHSSRNDAISTNIYFQDALQIYSYLCKLSGKDPANDGSATSLKSKTLTLELIVSIMENPGPTFLTREEFRDIIKEHLCDSILKNSVSTDKPVFAYSLGTFVSLVNNFREILKSEIAVFIENIFLKMLESGNSSFNHRSLALQVFYKITSKARTMLEFYVNYDCDMESTNIVEKMVDLLCKIAQGKYLRPEYSALIMPQQEPHLKILALESLVNLAKSLVHFTEEYQKRMEEINRLKNNSMETEREGEDFETVMGDEYRDNIFDRSDGIEKQRMMKNEIQKAIHKFNFKTKLGLKYFEKLGLMQLDDAKSVALFFISTPNLSKEKLGEYFGEEHEFNIKVLTEFAELVNFKNMPLDVGLRTFLRLFYLPGESQKIDRIMQVFASKFFKDNPKAFNSANAAYTLSYLLIMLQTDAHNPQVKKEEKMKLDQFIKLARGINDGMDLPEQELVGFYGRIQEAPLAIRDESKKGNDAIQNQSLKKKEEQFKLESAKMIEKGKEMIKQKKDVQYYKVINTDYVRPFFSEVLWSPILAVFGVVLERYDEPKIVQLCLEGLSNCVALTGLLHMDTERDTFLLSLVKFTNLKPVREIKEKNAKCIKLVLQLATTHGQYFRSSWKYVLECISKIDFYLHYSPQQSREGDIYSGDSPKNPMLPVTVDPVEIANSDMIKSIVDPNAINHIISKSGTFNLEEIIDFITCLCQMSEEELKSPHSPRIFGLQKLVEVAHFNMDRIKFIWSQIWNIMREHISNVAINSSVEIAFFAVDSLKQLSIKFLIKEELASLEFQKEFLKPFETICQKVQSDDIKELVLNCCNYIISHVMKDIKSGWKIIIDILIIGADSQKDSLVKLSFQIVEKIIKNNLDALREVFADTALLLLKLAKYKNDEIAIACLKHLKTLISGMVQQHESSSTHTYEGQPYLSYTAIDDEGNEGDRVVLVYGIDENVWTKILVALVGVCITSRKRVHMQSVITLFEILRTYGDGFSKDRWQEIINKVIKPLFDGVQNLFQNNKSISDDDFLIYNETCREAFLRMIDIYNLYYTKLGHIVDVFLQVLANCSQSNHEQLAQISIGALRYIINRCNVHFKIQEWDLIIDAFKQICRNTIPQQLLSYSLKPSSSPEKKSNEERLNGKSTSDPSLVQCIIQLMMIALIKDVTETYGHRFTDTQLLAVCNILSGSYEFAKKFNQQMYLRFILWKRGPLRDTDQLPALLKQEKESLSTYLLLTFNLYSRKKNNEVPDELAKNKHLNEFIDLGLSLMKNFCNKSEEYVRSIKQMPTGEDTSPIKKAQSGDSDALDLKDIFAKQEPKLKIHELDREITNIKSILVSVFLPNLEKVHPKEMNERLLEIVEGLINVSFYYIPKVPTVVEQGQPNVVETDSQSQIKGLLMKYYEYSYARGGEKLRPVLNK